jgi:F-type H+-transporting ATPase subunit b
MSAGLRWLGRIAFAVVLSASVPASALAGSEEDVLNQPIGSLFRWLNFALVFGAASYLISKNAPAFFRSRAELIEASIREAARAQAEADTRLREAEAKLVSVEQEVAELRVAARAEAAAEAERIRAVARDEMQKIEHACEAEIEATERAARLELKAMAARLATQRAEAILRTQVTPQVDAAMVRFFLESLGRSAN